MTGGAGLAFGVARYGVRFVGHVGIILSEVSLKSHKGVVNA